jgi:hypothetical protein
MLSRPITVSLKAVKDLPDKGVLWGQLDEKLDLNEEELLHKVKLTSGDVSAWSH